MASNSIGDFFVNLGLKTDKDSFDKGVKSIDNMTNGVNRLVTTVKNAAPVLAAALAGNFETAELRTAKAIGISTEALDSWKVAASMAGVSAEGLISNMSSLDQRLNRWKTGKGIDTGLATSLSLLGGPGFMELANMDPSKRIESIFAAARAMDDQKKAAMLIGDILGSEAQSYYLSLQLSGRELTNELEIGKKLTYTSEESKRHAEAFNHELQGVLAAGKSIGMLFGSEVGAALTPVLHSFREWLGINNKAISSGITGFVGKLGDLFNRMFGFVEKGYPIVKNFINETGGLEKWIVRIGLGLGGLKILQFSSSLTGVVGSIGLLKAALATGLVVTAGSLLDPDFVEKLGPKLKSAFGSIKKDAIDPLNKSFGELIKTLTNSDTVIEGLDKISTGLINFASDAVYGTIGSLEALIYQMSALGKAVKGDFKGAVGDLKSSSDVYTRNNGKVGRAIFGDALYGLLFPDNSAQTTWDNMVNGLDTTSGGGSIPDSKNLWKINDGIVKPNGGVVSVSPDDWIFAVKDIANLAGAFTPTGSGFAGGQNSFVINQTFNISGSKDIPQTLRQQAYKGTQEGLLDIINNTSQRLQLMPVTR